VEFDFLHSRTQFRALLDVERMRSDRSGRCFSLVVFILSEADNGLSDRNDGDFLRFAKFLQPGIRATDHAGFVDVDRIGVILWDTDESGAFKFLEKFNTESGTDRPEKCEVFVYPSTYLDDENQAHESAGPGSPHETTDSLLRDSSDSLAVGSTAVAQKTKASVLARQATAARIQENLEVSEELLSELTTEPNGARPRIHSLDSLLVRPMPWWKRAIDIVGAVTGMIVLSPVLLATAVVIKLTSPGPIFFSQMRIGRGGRRFRIHKFRSMIVDAEDQKKQLLDRNEQDGPAFKIEEDPRVTPVGGVIRATSIDELPQLWNVLKGDMSLVGPRPLPCSESDACEVWQKRRLDVTPGLTCIWQVQERRNKIPFADWARMDIRYIVSRSLKLDIKLIFRTIGTVFGIKGV